MWTVQLIWFHRTNLRWIYEVMMWFFDVTKCDKHGQLTIELQATRHCCKIDKSNVIVIIPRLYSDLSCHITKIFSNDFFVLLFIKIFFVASDYYIICLCVCTSIFIIARLRGYFYFHSITAFSPNNKRLFIFFLTKQHGNIFIKEGKNFSHTWITFGVVDWIL